MLGFRAPHTPDGESPHLAGSDRLAIFAALWGAALVLHVLGSPLGPPLTARVTATGITHLALGIAGVVLLLRPRSLAALVVACTLVPATAWLEAPVVGNHWILAMLVAVALVLATCIAYRTSSGIDRHYLEALAAPIARAIFLSFYAFAALSKVNRAFLNPKVSCANFFADQIAHSIGLHSVATRSGSAASHVIPIAVIAIELAVPLLLVSRRTRLIGVCVALLFHGLIALDSRHSFADFSSTIYALLVWFVPGQTLAAIAISGRRHVRRARTGIAFLIAMVLGVALGARSLTASPSWWRVAFRIRDLTDWVLTGTMTVFVAMIIIRRVLNSSLPDIEVPERSEARAGGRWLWFLPALAVVNGLTPYAGIKTAYSWNMYSNLVTAPGYSNSLVLPSTLHVTHIQDDLVEIIESADATLQAYADQHYLLTWTTLRTYTESHPGTTLRYVRRGSIYTINNTRPDASLAKPVAGWHTRLFAFRAIDATRPARCQDSFLGAN